MKNVFLTIVLMMVAFAFSQQFTEIATGIAGTANGKSIWGDLDNDGDLDLVTADAGGSFKIYRNDGAGVFTDTGFESWSMFKNVDLGDYDNDGDLDILFSGDWTSVYRNDSGTFTEVFPSLPGGMENNARWGDYDNDGDLDVLLTDYETARIYRNEGNGVFSDINAGFMELEYCKAWWVDYDCDGLLDVMITGEDMAGMTGSKTILYKNEGNDVFTDIISTLPDAYISLADWGDYDNDGDPDLLFTGYTSGPVTMLYRNDGNGVFTAISAGLVGVYMGSVQWGDFDNDGDLDIILTGWASSGVFFTKLYRNDGAGVFTDINAGLTNVCYGCAVWGDYDNDGDLDIFMNGSDGSNHVAKIYRNNSETPNTVPSKPTALVTEIVGDSIYLSFSPSTDAETPQAGLTYNIDITLNGEKYLSGMSDLSNGYRKIVKEGNLNYRTNYSLSVIAPVMPLPHEVNILNWKIQAIDNCFAGSDYSKTGDIDLRYTDDLILENNFLMTEFDLLKWEYAFPDTVDHYVIQIDEDSLFNTPLEHTYTISKTGKIITFLSVPVQDFSGYETMRSHTTYFWRVKPVYINGSLPTVFSEEPGTFIYIPYDIAPGTPQNFTITHGSSDIVLTWDAVEVKQKGVTYRVYSSTDPYAEFPAGYTLEQSGITTTSWSDPVSGNKKFYVVTAYYSL